MSGAPFIVRDLSAGYRGRDIVRNLTLAPLAAGEVMSLIGPNAAGKSTLLRALAGLLPARGTVRLGETDLLGLPLVEHSRLVTYTPQELPQQVALTVLETVVSAAGNEGGAEEAIPVLERLGIAHLAMDGLDRLSGGQRQLASLAQTLIRRPRVLLLDEPISALDLHYQLRVMKQVRTLAREEGMIVVMVLHDLSIAARWSDRIAVLAQGELVVEGAPEAALTPELLARIYRVSARVERCSRGELAILADEAQGD